MLSQAELLVLANWCGARNMTWTRGQARGGRPAVLLQRTGGCRDTMLLVIGAAERHLLDMAGQELAAASDLPALLDAVDGGVADGASAARRAA